MLIEMDKYQPNSLRKGRRDAFEKDLHDAFTMFSYKYTDPRLLTINDFSDFWKASQLCFIVCVNIYQCSCDARTKKSRSTSSACTVS
jgi:hypothetical protein